MRLENNFYNKNNYNVMPAKDVNFCAILHVDRSTKNINDSWFFRDIKTLEDATDHIYAYFPNGADILVYGCSTGEGNISLKALMPENKYRVIGYDNSADAIRIGKRGVYTLFSNWDDSYLLPNGIIFDNCSEEERKQMLRLRGKFHNMMYEVPYCEEFRDINNKDGFKRIKCAFSSFEERFYCIRESFKKQIDLRFGDFINVGQVRKERPVGGIFFRNAIYHMCKNNVNEVLEYNSPAGVFKNKNLLMEYLVNGVYKTLDDNGIFVLGNHLKEHLFLADDTTPPENTICFKDTPFYVDKNPKHRKNASLKCFKKSPLIEALLKDGRFIPTGFSYVTTYGCKVKVPVIFKKIL